MPNAKNVAAVKELKARFEDSSAVFLTEYRGLTVTQISELRKALGADVTYSVAKNTMIKLAAQEAGVEGLAEEQLHGPTAIAFVSGDAAVDAAKALKKFDSENKAFVIKGGAMDGASLDAAGVLAIADMDNRETTLAKIAGGFDAALSGFAALLNAPASEMARLAAALEEKK